MLDTLAAVDVLQEHLTRARSSGGLFARSVARPPWGLRLPGTIQLAVHAVTHGSAWLWLDDPSSAIELAPGDVALVRGGPDHCIAHEPSAVCMTYDEFQTRNGKTDDSEGPDTAVFLCGAYEFAGDIGGQLIQSLPPALRLTCAAEDPLQQTIALLSDELQETAPGQQTVLDRLLDVVLVQSLRAAFRQDAHGPRWFHASSDPRLEAPLRAMHGDPAHQWTVPELASFSGLSRAAFARAFQQALGQAPMQYLTEWRMSLARDHLRFGDLTLGQIADAVGYGSPYAFAAAFNRHHGVPPGRWRARAASGTDAREGTARRKRL